VPWWLGPDGNTEERVESASVANVVDKHVGGIR